MSNTTLEFSAKVGKEESESAGPVEDTRHAPPWGADPKRWRMLGLYALGCMANQAMWIGFAPIEEDVKTSFGCSSTWVNLLSLVFMIATQPEENVGIAFI